MSVRNVQKRHKWALDFTKYACHRTVIILLILGCCIAGHTNKRPETVMRELELDDDGREAVAYCPLSHICCLPPELVKS